MSSLLDLKETLNQAPAQNDAEQKKPAADELKIHIPNAPDDTFVPLGKSQIKRVYEDKVGERLLIIVDEVAELLSTTKGADSEEMKEENRLKNEMRMIIDSLTRLGRSSGVHMILCTQRNDVKTIDGPIQHNALALDTKVIVKDSEE